eukprot:scaffold3165_cov62-Cyclotella_meneghiniana.AAC.1
MSGLRGWRRVKISRRELAQGSNRGQGSAPPTINVAPPAATSDDEAMDDFRLEMSGVSPPGDSSYG